MGLFGIKDPMKEKGGWENAMTEAEIAEMERKGYDVSALRATRNATVAEETASEEKFHEQRKATAVAIDLNRLTSYRDTPRSTESEFFKDVAGRAPLFGKEKWREKIENAQLVYGAVVQANSNLWLPGNNENYPAVIVFALDSTHTYDVQWLSEVAEKISVMKESAHLPSDSKEFINILRDDKSEFCFPLATSLAGEADAWCVTYEFETQSILPGNRLPEDGIVPFLLDEKPKKQIPIKLRPIPGKYYKAHQ